MLKYTKMSNFLQNAQNHGFCNFNFWFLSRGKNATINYYLNESKHVIMKKIKELVSNPILCVTSKFVCGITTKPLMVEGKMVNYWVQIYKLLSGDIMVVLYTVTI